MPAIIRESGAGSYASTWSSRRVAIRKDIHVAQERSANGAGFPRSGLFDDDRTDRSDLLPFDILIGAMYQAIAQRPTYPRFVATAQLGRGFLNLGFKAELIPASVFAVDTRDEGGPFPILDGTETHVILWLDDFTRLVDLTMAHHAMFATITADPAITAPFVLNIEDGMPYLVRVGHVETYRRPFVVSWEFPGLGDLPYNSSR